MFTVAVFLCLHHSGWLLGKVILMNPELSKIVLKLAKNYPELTEEQLLDMATQYFRLGQILVRLYLSSQRKECKDADIQDNS